SGLRMAADLGRFDLECDQPRQRMRARDFFCARSRRSALARDEALPVMPIARERAPTTRGVRIAADDVQRDVWRAITAWARA
ncbi:hypothetical protein LN471_21675, partial [Xanthomonas campestris]|nr:hypothetical protein [Xanthomonas campestris]